MNVEPDAPPKTEALVAVLVISRLSMPVLAPNFDRAPDIVALISELKPPLIISPAPDVEADTAPVAAYSTALAPDAFRVIAPVKPPTATSCPDVVTFWVPVPANNVLPLPEMLVVEAPPIPIFAFAPIALTVELPEPPNRVELAPVIETVEDVAETTSTSAVPCETTAALAPPALMVLLP